MGGWGSWGGGGYEGGGLMGGVFVVGVCALGGVRGGVRIERGYMGGVTRGFALVGVHGAVLWGGRGVRGEAFFAIFFKNQKHVACSRNWKELNRQKSRAKFEQKSNKI